MKKYLFIFSLAIIFSLPVWAATTDVDITENINVSDITFGSGTTTLIVFASSQTESLTVDGGTFTVTNPGSSFKIGSANSAVKSIKIKNGGATVACQANSTPGASYVTLPTMAATYTIEPSTITDCASLCSTIQYADSYNAFPTCGALTCQSGYTKSGSGASAICVSSGGGGSISTGGSSAPANPNTPITSQQFTTSQDGTQIISNTVVSKTNGVPSQAVLTSIIKTSPAPVNNQTVSLNSSLVAEVKSVDLTLSTAIIKEIISAYGQDNIDINIVAKTASLAQQSNEARNGLYMIGFDIISVNIKVKDTQIKTFTQPIILTFDVSKIANRNDLKVYWFNTNVNKWEIAGNGGDLVGDKLILTINHLTEFSLMRDMSKVTPAEISANRDLQWQQIQTDAAVVFDSGTRLDKILSHNQVEKNTSAQNDGMKKYTEVIIKNSSNLKINEKYAINNFIVYGTKNSKKLGAGERAGVINSFKAAFGKLPTSESDWIDVLAIANGRWPNNLNQSAENKAKIEFKKVYKREAKMANANDNAAVTVISYGLRPGNRNLNSEKAAIKSFKAIYDHAPVSALAWDIVRAIAYSGAKR